MPARIDRAAPRERGRRENGGKLSRPRPPVKGGKALSPCLLRRQTAIFRSYVTLNPEASVKTDIHPTYATATVKCACGNTFVTRSTQAEIHTDICSACHPFFTGKQKLIDTAGRVERFRQKYAGTAGKSS